MRPNCSHYDEQAAKLTGFLDSGMEHDAVVAALVKEYGGQAVLTAPIDRGFNRLAWAVPYIVGVLMLGGIFITARRWSHRQDAVAPADAPVDKDLSDRLDDELRSLD